MKLSETMLVRQLQLKSIGCLLIMLAWEDLRLLLVLM